MIFVCVIKETPLNKRSLLLVYNLIHLTNRFHEFRGAYLDSAYNWLFEDYVPPIFKVTVGKAIPLQAAGLGGARYVLWRGLDAH